MKTAKTFFRVLAALLTLSGLSLSAAEAKTASPAAQNVPVAPPTRGSGGDPSLPDAPTMQRLARRALFDVTGIMMHVGPVILRERLPDGSWLVDVTLENGRMVRGRLYKNRRRYRIAVDARDLYSQEQTIQIVK